MSATPEELIDRITNLEHAMALQGASVAVLSRACTQLAVLVGARDGASVSVVTAVLRAMTDEMRAQAKRLGETPYQDIVEQLWARYRAETPCAPPDARQS